MFDWPTFVITLRELHMACSQEKMAQELGVCAKTISNWERGVVQPQWRHKSRLLVLGVGYKYTRKQSGASRQLGCSAGGRAGRVGLYRRRRAIIPRTWLAVIVRRCWLRLGSSRRRSSPCTK